MKKVLIHGPILTRTGYGEMARFALKSLLRHPERFDVYVNNITWGAHPSWIIEPEIRDLLDSLLVKTAEFIATKQRFDISIQCTIPPEFKNYAHVNIGYTAGIETTKAHPQWVISCNEMDRVITISSFAKSVLLSTIAEVVDGAQNQHELKIFRQVDYIGFPVKTRESKEIKNLELTSSSNFLAVGQYGPRKNFDNLVAWFVETFRKNEDVGLVLKLSYLNNSKLDEFFVRNQIGKILSNFPDRKCPIYLVHGNLTDEEMNYLYQHPTMKALVHTSHGEGYGIPLFEAAYNCLPVIAAGWGGHADFLNYIKEVPNLSPGKKKMKKIKKTGFAEVEYSIDNIQDFAVCPNIMIKDSKWCYPDKTSFCNTMKRVLNDYGKYKVRAEELQKNILEKYTEENICEQFCDLILPKQEANIDDWLSSMKIEDL